MEETPQPNVSAMVGLAFGILAWAMRFMGCLASIVGLGLPFQMIGMVFDVVGLGMGIAGIMIARRQSGNGMAMGIVGTVLSAIDLLITLVTCLLAFTLIIGFMMLYVGAIFAVVLSDA